MTRSDDGSAEDWDLPSEMFQRQDESSDERFYAEPRFVTHIDDATIASLTEHYRAVLPHGGRLLDLMSSWVSHLPTDGDYRQVTGLGMNEAELRANPRLDDYVIQNLNQNPSLPWRDGSFDAVMIAVSVQYLIRPFEVFAEIGRILDSGGQCVVAMSHRLFPTKAVYAFQALSPTDRCRLVGAYMHRSGSFASFETLDLSPPAADPLWVVIGTRS